MVTHRLRYLECTNRIIVMDNGSIAKETTYSELAYSDSQHLDNDTSQDETSDVSSNKEDVTDSELPLASDKDVRKAEEGTKEDRQYGGVSWRTYWRYLHAGNSVPFLVLLTFAVILPEGKFRRWSFIIQLIKLKLLVRSFKPTQDGRNVIRVS